jgi:hypothetical protein
MSNVGINPRNKTEEQIIEICTRAHNWLAKELNVASSQEFGRTAIWGKDAFHAGLWIERNKQSVLNFRNLYGNTVSDMLRIIGHELRHAMQYKHGMLKVDQFSKVTTGVHGRWERGYWNDEYYSGKYRDAPWEIDARAYQNQYKQMIIDSGVVTSEELDIVLPGNRVTYFNEDKKQEELSESNKERIHWFKAATISKAQSDKNDKLLHKAFKDAGFIAPTSPKGRWSFGDAPRAKRADMNKAWKSAKKEFALKYRKDAIAYLTDSEYKSISKADQYWEAQKNILQYDEVEITEGDLVY